MKTKKTISTLNKILGDFPGGPAVKNPPSNVGDAGSIPVRWTKIPRAAGQLSPRTATTELTHLNERAVCHKLQIPRTLEPARHN